MLALACARSGQFALTKQRKASCLKRSPGVVGQWLPCVSRHGPARVFSCAVFLLSQPRLFFLFLMRSKRACPYIYSTNNGGYPLRRMAWKKHTTHHAFNSSSSGAPAGRSAAERIGGPASSCARKGGQQDASNGLRWVLPQASLAYGRACQCGRAGRGDGRVLQNTLCVEECVRGGGRVVQNGRQVGRRLCRIGVQNGGWVWGTTVWCAGVGNGCVFRMTCVAEWLRKTGWGDGVLGEWAGWGGGAGHLISKEEVSTIQQMDVLTHECEEGPTSVDRWTA